MAEVPEDVGILHSTVSNSGDVYGIAFRALYRRNLKTDRLEYREIPPRAGLYQIVEGQPGEFNMGAGTHLSKYAVAPANCYR